MKKIEIIIPVKNEAANIKSLVERIDLALNKAKISYSVLFVVDASTDSTIEEIKRVSEKYPIRFQLKQGKPGKAFSIIEGAKAVQTETIVMIDGDLQYPPESIPEMVELSQENGIVVANRVSRDEGRARRIFSKINKFLVGKMLFGIDVDVQSGLKVFRKEVVDHLDLTKIDQWSLDIPLIHTSLELGHKLATIDIHFDKRNAGVSKVNVVSTTLQIVSGALKTRFAKRQIYSIAAPGELMTGAGVVFKRQRFITHTTLPHIHSAINTFSTWQILFFGLAIDALIFGIILNPYLTAIVFIASLSTIYFIDAIFNLFLVMKSLHFPPELQFSDQLLEKIDDKKLPLYSVLCPLYKEWQVLPQFVQAIEELDYPKDKLDVLLLLEENDKATIEKATQMDLPKYFRILVVPDSQPKTKPKACNYGLSFAKGEYVVIYDAEDKPEASQLKKAVLGFAKVPANVWCLQAKLNYYNPHHNLLTRLFTAEYSLWFDVILTGLQSIQTTIPLGGTSNHFRTKDLLTLQGWDPFNVTEDCDLGVRLFKKGYKTAIIDSTTWEEANSHVGNWIRQRSRWIKGYIQTYLVHMRNPWELIRTQGIHAMLFQLIVGGKIAFMVINPFLWLATIAYFTLYRFVGPTIESLYPAPVFYMAVFSLVFGNFLYLYYYMIGCAKRGHWSVIKYVFFIPFYWVLVSIAAAKAVVQLLFKPHYWEKTVHGFHLGNNASASIVSPKVIFAKELIDKGKKLLIAESGILVFSALLGNVFDFLYNTYLGRVLRLEDFGLISLFSTVLFVAKIPMSALARTVTYKSAFFLGKHQYAVKEFWIYWRRKVFVISFIVTILWILSSKFFQIFFQSDSIVPFILFTPVWIIGTVSAVDSGFLGGTQKFKNLAIIAIVFSVSKFIFSFVLVTAGMQEWVYLSIPLAMTVTFVMGWYFSSQIPTSLNIGHTKLEQQHFPLRFFVGSVLIKLSEIAFYTTDVIMAKHYLSPIEAGEYGLISLIGKMIFFIGGLFSQFILPFVSYDEGAQRNSKATFYKLFFASMGISFVAYVGVGILGWLTAPILFGPKILSVTYLLPVYGFGMFCFQNADTIMTYYQAKNKSIFSVLGVLLGVSQIVAMMLFHRSLDDIVWVVCAVGTAYFVLMLAFHFAVEYLADSSLSVIVSGYIQDVKTALKDLVGLLKPLPKIKSNPVGLRILIFNWRDTKHIWSGGAEVYVHELAKRWVKMGHTVTLFSGNDGRSSRHDVIDGVQIVRRGGFFFVYIWAFAYYLLRFRGKYDVIIDSENGIPFFTPLYAKEKKFLLIHHVHQEVFRKSLPYPGYLLASFLEQKLMPWAYRHSDVITVSPSSKADILDHKLTQKEPTVIYNGVDLEICKPGKKSVNPLVLYLGRLKDHKSIPVFIHAAKKVLADIPNVEFVIAGDGPDKKPLTDLVKELNLEEKIKFSGKVTNEQKVELYQKAWVFVNPSLMEGWGITNIEANACGTPVVASNVSGLRDSVHNPHSGFLLPYGNVEEFSNHIEKLIRNKKMRETMSIESMEWAAKFDWDLSAIESIALFKKNLNI